VAYYNFTGFELLAAEGTTSGSSLTYVSSPTKGSEGALRANLSESSTANYVQLGTSAQWGASTAPVADTGSFAQATLCMHFHFRFAANPGATATILQNANADFKLQLDSSGQLVLLNQTGATVYTSSALSTGTWYWIGLKIVVGDSGAYDLRLNGTSLSSGTSDFYGSTATHTTLRLGVIPASSLTLDAHFDNFVVSDTLSDNQLIVKRLDVVGNGANTAWTGDYTAIDEIPPTTSDYISNNTNTAKESYDFEACASSASVVSDPLCVKLVVNAVRGSTSNGAIKLLCREGTTDNTSGSYTTTSTNTRIGLIQPTTPGASAWSTTNLDSSEWGVQGNYTGRQSNVHIVSVMVLDRRTTEFSGSATQTTPIVTQSASGYPGISANFADWGRRCPLTIQSSYVVNGPHTDFPVLITEATLPSEILDADGSYRAQSDAGDIRFTADASGDTELAFDVVTFTQNNDPALGKAEIWVKVPSISSSSNTDIFIWYKASSTKSLPAASAATGSESVWTNYLGVYHLKESSGTYYDSTGNSNDSTAGSASQVDARIGKGQDFSGAQSAGIDLPGINSSQITVQTWIRFDRAGSWEYSINRDDRSSNRFWCLGKNASNAVQVYAFNAAGGYAGPGGGTLSVDTWYLLAFTYDGTYVKAWLDGAQVGSDSSLSDLKSSGTQKIELGFQTSNPLDGKVDEARIYNAARSGDWLHTEYHNQNNPSTFIVEGTAVDPNALIGAIAQTAPKVTQDATGKKTHTGTAAQTTPKASQVAAGIVVNPITGTISQTTPKTTQSASGSKTYRGTSAQTTPKATQSAAGKETLIGTGGSVTSMPAQSATATETYSGTAEQTTPNVIQEATDEASGPTVEGAIEQTTPAATSSLTGTNVPFRNVNDGGGGSGASSHKRRSGSGGGGRLSAEGYPALKIPKKEHRERLREIHFKKRTESNFSQIISRLISESQAPTLVPTEIPAAFIESLTAPLPPLLDPSHDEEALLMFLMSDKDL
jgi:hypothetical protein